MRYEWNETKNTLNKSKHGLDFADMERFDWDLAVYVDSQIDHSTGERRDLVVGPVSDWLLVTVIVTDRNG